MPSEGENSGKFPYEIVRLTKENARIQEDFKGFIGGGVRVGPKGYFFSQSYEIFGEKIYNFELKPSDVFIATFPRCGTTWTQEMVWMLRNDFDYEGGKESLDIRFPFMDADVTIDARAFEIPHVKKHLKTSELPKPGDRIQLAMKANSPRCLKTHMPFSLLPPKLLDTCKVIYVLRDPRDVLVSIYHHHFMIRSFGFDGTFETFFEYFLNDEIIYGPYWSHLREAWELRDHPNLLLIKFEDMKKDTKGIVKKVASFLGKPVTDGEQLEKLVKHLSVDSMKANPSMNGDDALEAGFFKSEGFIRSGNVGGWKTALTDKMKERLEKWSAEQSKGLDKILGYC